MSLVDLTVTIIILNIAVFALYTIFVMDVVHYVLYNEVPILHEELRGISSVLCQ
jgi:hypothetical protein